VSQVAEEGLDAAPRLRQTDHKKGQGHFQSRAEHCLSRASYAAEVIERMPQNPCGSLIDKKLLAITDLNEPGSRSVTNAIEEVLHERREHYGLDLPTVIIYRDTAGVWDGVNHIEGTFRGFYPIRETDLARAIEKAPGRERVSMRPHAALNPCEPQ
jgi:hypothetical protein